MAIDTRLTERIRQLIGDLPNVDEKRMMGGVCFLLNGNMICGADRSKDGERRFMFRVGKENADFAGALPGAVPMVQGGRTMGGLYFVNADEHEDAIIGEWLALAMRYVRSLPPK